MKKNKLVI